MRTPRSALGLLIAAAFVVSGCTEKKDEKKPADPAEVKTDDKKPEGPKPEQPAEVAEAGSHPECIAPRSETPVEAFEAGGRSYERKGSTLSLKTSDPDDEFVIGQLSDVKDFTPENKANVKVALKWFAEQKVDAIAVTGDLGETQESIEQVLRTVAEPGVPVLAIIGNRECRDHFAKALDVVSKDHKNVVNMNQIRVFNADDVSVVSLPGYYNKSYIHCSEGCEYSTADVDALDQLLPDATGPVNVLISHGPPKMSGAKGLDRIHEEVNVGDPKLAEYLKNGKLPFGLFGNIQEAGGYASDLSGDKRIDQKVFVDSLYLNPGPIDSVRWQMLDGTESLGMAGLLRIKGKQGSYEIYRIRPGEAKVE